MSVLITSLRAALCLFRGVILQADSVAADLIEKPTVVLFHESFDDSRLLQRNWYDGDKFAITDTQPFAGKGCLEYAWTSGTTTPASSSGIRHLFEPTETVALRCYLKLSKGWDWNGHANAPRRGSLTIALLATMNGLSQTFELQQVRTILLRSITTL